MPTSWKYTAKTINSQSAGVMVPCVDSGISQSSTVKHLIGVRDVVERVVAKKSIATDQREDLGDVVLYSAQIELVKRW